MTTPAGLASFKRAMITRFGGTCVWCAEETKPGVDYAFLAGNGKWNASCVSCSSSIPARIHGIATRIGKVQDTLTEAQLATLSVPENLAEAIAGSLSDSENKLISAAMVALRQDVDRLVAANTPAEAEASDVETGRIYMVNGEAFRIRLSKAGRQYAMRLIGAREGVKPSWEYDKGGIATVRRSGVLMTAEQAAHLGHLTSHCVFCSLELTDARSTVVGYGPVCAEKHHLPWG